jgi:flagellar biosynthetic protein FlhB
MEKTEPATEHRREKLKEDGDSPYSSQVTKAALAWSAVGCLFMLPPFALDAVFAHAFGAADTAIRNQAPASALGLGLLLSEVLPAALVLAVAVAVALAAAGAAQGAWYFSPKRLQLDPNKLNPVEGAKRIFSLQALLGLLMNVLRLAVMSAVALVFVQLHAHDIGAGDSPSHGIVPQALGFVRSFLLWMLGALSLLALLDWVQQKWLFERRAKMSMQELRDEHKEVEGDPEVKAKLRELRQELAASPSPEAAAHATAVITNPLHIAVAVRFDPACMDVPLLLAMGRGERARAIRDAAQRHGVPVVRNVPLARLLWRFGREGEPVPARSFEALAELLAHVLEGVPLWPATAEPLVPEPPVPPPSLPTLPAPKRPG